MILKSQDYSHCIDSEFSIDLYNHKSIASQCEQKFTYQTATAKKIKSNLKKKKSLFLFYAQAFHSQPIFLFKNGNLLYFL